MDYRTINAILVRAKQTKDRRKAKRAVNCLHKLPRTQSEQGHPMTAKNRAQTLRAALTVTMKE